MSIKSFLKITIFSFFFLLFCSNIGYDSTFNTPGKIEFIGDAGSPNVFVFNQWKFTEVELPDNDFTKVKLGLEINISSMSTEYKDLENSIRKKKDYFYVKKFPKATVSIDGASKLEDGQYETKAMLTLKGKTRPVTLTFSVSEEAPYVVTGSGIVRRKLFGFKGKGPKWEVPVNFEVTLPEL